MTASEITARLKEIQNAITPQGYSLVTSFVDDFKAFKDEQTSDLVTQINAAKVEKEAAVADALKGAADAQTQALAEAQAKADAEKQVIQDAADAARVAADAAAAQAQADADAKAIEADAAKVEAERVRQFILDQAGKTPEEAHDAIVEEAKPETAKQKAEIQAMIDSLDAQEVELRAKLAELSK